VHVCWAEDEPGDPPPPAVEEEEENNADTTEDAEDEDDTVEDDGGEEQGDDGSADEDVPEGVRRRRPRTAGQERAYKQRRTREDPFLNQLPVDPSLAGGIIYNPADWLVSVIVGDVSRYMVQDGDGAIVGYETIAVELESNPVLGDFIHLSRRREGTAAAIIDLWLFAETFKPRKKTTRRPLADQTTPGDTAPAAADAGNVYELYADMSEVAVDYFFDRVTITHQTGGVSAIHTMRQLPFSYDVDSLPLLARQLKFTHGEWPFEAAISNPERETNLAVAIDKPVRVNGIFSAEGAAYKCYELTLHLAGDGDTYWVERLPPHRLVKFTDGVYTFTLLEYMEQQ